jgi:hypothetical protein
MPQTATTDPSQLPYSQERLAGLRDALIEALVEAGEDREMIGATLLTLRGVAKFIWVRASALSTVVVVEAMANIFGQRFNLGPVDSALKSD